MEPIHPTVADLSGTGAKYQVDKTQSTRLRYWSLTKNKGKTSSKVEPNTKPLQLQTFADVLAFLLSEDELDKESDEEEVLAVGEDMDKDPQAAKEVRTPSPKQDQPEPFHFSSVRSLRNNGKYEEASVSYADLKASIEEYYDENVAYINQTDKLVESTMSTIDKSSTTIKDLYKGLNVITKLLKDINTAVKGFDLLPSVYYERSSDSCSKTGRRTALKGEVSSLRQDTSEIKSMMTREFNRHQMTIHFSSFTPTLALTNIRANVEGGNATNTATEEPPSYTEGETEDSKMAIPISSIQPTEVPQTQAQPITTITTHPKSSQAAPRIDKGKWIATGSAEDPSKKLVHASTIVRPDPDEEVKVPYMINGNMYYLTDTEMQAYLDKEEKLRKAVEEARTSCLDPKPENLITDVKHPPSPSLAVLYVYRNNDKINFDGHNPFKFTDFGITELDELSPIIQKKKNSIVKYLMISLSKRYERLKKIHEELGIQYALPVPALNKPHTKPQEEKGSMWNWNPRSRCLGSQDRMDIHKLRKLIADHPDQEKVKSKRVKLEALGYQID
ncbi:hypothetical protein Tco_1345577 [Tanacetum coccineum]